MITINDITAHGYQYCDRTFSYIFKADHYYQIIKEVNQQEGRWLFRVIPRDITLYDYALWVGEGCNLSDLDTIASRVNAMSQGDVDHEGF